MEKKRVNNVNKQEYLELHQIFPMYVDTYGNTYYKTTKQLIEVLDRYDIKYICIPNKLRPQ